MLHLPVNTLNVCVTQNTRRRMHVFKYPTCFKVSYWCAHTSKINYSDLMQLERSHDLCCVQMVTPKLSDNGKIKADVSYTILDNGTKLITKWIYVYINQSYLAGDFISKSKSIQYVQDTSKWYTISHHLHQKIHQWGMFHYSVSFNTMSYIWWSASDKSFGALNSELDKQGLDVILALISSCYSWPHLLMVNVRTWRACLNSGIT